MAEVLIKVGTTQNNLTDMPNPSKMEWSLQDVSAGESGNPILIRTAICWVLLVMIMVLFIDYY